MDTTPEKLDKYEVWCPFSILQRAGFWAVLDAIPFEFVVCFWEFHHDEMEIQ